MTWYEFLLFVHICGAIIWIGGAFVFQVFGMVELRSRDTAAIARFAVNAGRIGERLFTPTSLVVVLAGIWLVQGGRLPNLPSRIHHPAPRPRASTNPA